MRARIFGGLGVLLTLVAAAVIAAPNLTDSITEVAALLESRDPERLLLVLGSVVGLYAAWSARASSPDEPAVDGPAAGFESAGDPTETVSTGDQTRTGESFDDRIAVACAGDDEELRAVRSDLADTAASAHARAADRTSEVARREIRSGAWTADPIAAAFLADESGPNFSLLARLRAWLDSSAERRRRIDRTVEAVGGILDKQTDLSEDTSDNGTRDEDASDGSTSDEEGTR
jgi:hypothetical protein